MLGKARTQRPRGACPPACPRQARGSIRATHEKHNGRSLVQFLLPTATARSSRSAALFRHAKPSVIKEAGKCVPAAEAIIDCLGRMVVPGERSGLTRPKSNRGGGNIRCVRSDPPAGPVLVSKFRTGKHVRMFECNGCGDFGGGRWQPRSSRRAPGPLLDSLVGGPGPPSG